MADNLLTMRDREQDVQRGEPLRNLSDDELKQLIKQKKQEETVGGGSDILGRLSTGAETAGDIFLGLGGAKTGGVSQLDELIKLETLKSKRALDLQKEESAERKGRLDDLKIEAARKKLETEAPIIKGVQETPPLAQQDITVGGQQTPTDAQTLFERTGKKSVQNITNRGISSERSITIEQGGKFVNIPTIIDGQQLSAEEAIAHANRTGQNSGVFDTQDEAIIAAENRSRELDRLSGGAGILRKSPIEEIPTSVTGLPTDVQPDVIQTQQLDTVFQNLPSGNAEEALSTPQVTGFPTLDSLVQEIGNIPLTLDTVRETVDNTGKKSRTTSKSINPLVTKFLEAKLQRVGKLDDVQLNVLQKGLQERATNTRNSSAIEALLQNNTAVWKAAKLEKEGVPSIPLPGGRESAILKRAVGKVAGALDITGFSWTKAYVGQRFETAMALSKIITGGARIIKSVIQALLKTLPVDNGIVDDMEALTTQSISNSVARATGRPLTKEEMQERDVRIVGILDTEAASVPEGQQVRNSRIVVVNGIRREVKYKDFINFLDVLEENDTLEFPDLEPTE